MSDQTLPVNSDMRCEEAVQAIRRAYRESRYIEVDIRVGERQRTLTQNKALHLWFRFLAETLNDAGLDMRAVLKPDFEMSWTESSVKEYLFRPVYQAMTQKKSTAEANRVEYSDVADEIGRHLQQKLGIKPPEWPKRRDAA